MLEIFRQGLREPERPGDLELTALGRYIWGDMDALGGEVGKGTWTVVFKSLLLLKATASSSPGTY